jgi:hypothetical protein
MWPPLLLRCQFGRYSGFPLFFPLFLLWPLPLLVLPLLIAALGALWALLGAAELRRWLKLFRGLYLLLCATRGTHVDARGPMGRVAVWVI